MNNSHIVVIGSNGFPFGTAEINKLTLISKSLVKIGCKVTIISKKGVHDPSKKIEINVQGNFEGVNYIYTSGSIYRSKNVLIRNLLKLYGIINEFIYILKLRTANKHIYAIVSTMNLFHLIYYYLLKKILRFSLFLHYAELVNIREKRIDKYFERIAFKLVNGVFPISDYLVDTIKINSPQTPFLKIPVLCDFEVFDRVNVFGKTEPCFLFVGAAGYFEIIEFIINSFDNIKLKHEYCLKLICTGNFNDLRNIENLINSKKTKEKIILLSDLNYHELIREYKKAFALLIPLRKTLQDIARFPHKIGEYTASKRPIITTQIGEINNYFSDMENVIAAKNYSIDDYVERLEFIIKNKILAEKIGTNGRKIGERYFDYNLYGLKIINFIMKKEYDSHETK